MLASGLYKRSGTWSDYSSSAEKCRDQRNSSVHHVQYNIDGKCWARPQEHCTMYMGRGKPSAGATYHWHHKYDQTTPKGRDSCRLTTDSVPLVLFLEKDKGCTILSFATTNKRIYIFLKRWESPIIFILMFLNLPMFSLLYRYYSWNVAISSWVRRRQRRERV